MLSNSERIARQRAPASIMEMTIQSLVKETHGDTDKAGSYRATWNSDGRHRRSAGITVGNAVELCDV